MSESTAVTPRIDEAGTEIELSAQELLALSDSRRNDQRETSLTLQPSRPATGVLQRKSDAPRASIKRYVSATRMSLSLLATVAIVGAAYVLTSSGGANHSTANTSQRIDQSEWDPSEWPAPERFAEGEPVRFVNPFDTDEVFEFPPGTTETEARDAVAGFLLERAMSRQKT